MKILWYAQKLQSEWVSGAWGRMDKKSIYSWRTSDEIESSRKHEEADAEWRYFVSNKIRYLSLPSKRTHIGFVITLFRSPDRLKGTVTKTASLVLIHSPTPLKLTDYFLTNNILSICPQWGCLATCFCCSTPGSIKRVVSNILVKQSSCMFVICRDKRC